MTTSRPEPAEVMRRIFRAQMRDVRTAVPAQILEYDPVNQAVDVQPMIREVISDGEGGEVEYSYSILRNVPVAFPRGGEFFISFPLAPGDFVFLIFAEWSVNRFRELGREAHPVDLERHGLSGAVAIPGFYPDSLLLDEVDEQKMVMGKDGGAQIRIAPDGQVEISTRGGTTQYVALADKVKTQLDALAQSVNDLRTAMGLWVVAPTDGGAALKLAIATWLAATVAPQPVGSTKVKAEE